MDSILFEVRALIEAIWRRRWQALVLSWVVCVVGWVAVAVLPDKYQSEARIYVDTDSMLGPLLKGIAVRADVGAEVAVMQRTLLSRPNLQQTARATDLDLQASTPQEMDALLERLAKDTKIALDGPKLYRVSYVSNSPLLAKSVVQSLLTIFVEGNLGKSRADLEGARAFIARQIVEYEGELKLAEQRLAEFKTKNIDILSGGNFGQRLEDARRTYENARYSAEEATTRRNGLVAQLRDIPQKLDVNAAPQVIVNNNNEKPSSPLALRVQEMERLLDAQKLKATEKHPSVLQTQMALDALKERLAAEQAAAAEAAASAAAAPQPTASGRSQVHNPLYEQVKLKLVDAESEVASWQRRVERSQEDVVRLQEMAKTAPLIEAEMANLNRDYAVVKSQYEELLGRRESARISQAADSTTDAVNFRIIEPPHVPTLPTSPNRPLLLAIVLVAGLGAGVGFSVLLDKMESSFRTPERLTEAFGFPVLGSVSSITTPSERRSRLAGNVTFGMTAGSLIAVFGVVMLISLNILAAPHFLPEGKSLSEGAATLLNRSSTLAKDIPGLIDRLSGFFK